MFGYLYIILVCFVPLYIIFRDINLFLSNNYNPYIFTKKKNNYPITLFIILFLFISYFIEIGVNLLTISIYSFIVVSIFLLITLNVLNYLCFKESKDYKIIYHTVIANLTFIIIGCFLLHIINQI